MTARGAGDGHEAALQCAAPGGAQPRGGHRGGRPAQRAGPGPRASSEQVPRAEGVQAPLNQKIFLPGGLRQKNIFFFSLVIKAK